MPLFLRVMMREEEAGMPGEAGVAYAGQVSGLYEA